MPNTSASGGVLAPSAVPSWVTPPPTIDNTNVTVDSTLISIDADGAFPQEDAQLDAVFQMAVVAITGIPGSLVRPRWQPGNPKQPGSDVNWCAIGVMVETPDDGPVIQHVSTQPTSLTVDSTEPTVDSDMQDVNGILQTIGADRFVDHEEIELLTTFYGPLAGRYAKRLRDGLRVPQNTEMLGVEQIRFVSSGPVRTVPEFVDQQWVMRKDMQLRFRRKVTRYYAVENILIAEINVISDTNINDTIVVPPGSTVEP